MGLGSRVRVRTRAKVRLRVTNLPNPKPDPNPHQIRDSVTDILREKGNSFEHAVIYRVSVAAAPLAAWVKANLEYSSVLHKIAPLEQANAELQAELDSSKERLGKCKDALGMLDAKVVELRDDFSKRTAEAEALKVSCRGDAREM